MASSRLNLAYAGVLIAVALGLQPLGCGGEEPLGADVRPIGCPAGTEAISDLCAGVADAPICAGDTCGAGVSCSSTTAATDDASLTAALTGAGQGSCVALAPGSYGDVALPAGVSLLGRGAAFVSVNSLSIAAGSDAVVRGLSVGLGGVSVAGATGLTLDSIRVSGSSGNGVTIAPGSSVTLQSMHIEGSVVNGVKASDTGAVQMKETIIESSLGPGLWAQCDNGCGCAAPPTVGLSGVILRDNKIIGASFVGIVASLDAVDIGGNTVTEDFLAGGGLSISGCSTASVTRARIHDNSSFGILVDASGGSFGGADPAMGVEVSANYTGVWIQRTPAVGDGALHMENCKLVKNRGVGLGMSGEARGITFWRSLVEGTESTVVPVIDNKTAGADAVGDALVWRDKAQADLKDVTLRGSARASVLIDGEVGTGSVMAGVTLEGGDEERGIFQQNFPINGAVPAVSGGTPAVVLSATELYAIPVAPAAPAGQ